MNKVTSRLHIYFIEHLFSPSTEFSLSGFVIMFQMVKIISDLLEIQSTWAVYETKFNRSVQNRMLKKLLKNKVMNNLSL